MFAVLSKARYGFDNTFLANFLATLTDFLPKHLKMLPNPTVCIVLSLTFIDFFHQKLRIFQQII